MYNRENDIDFDRDILPKMKY